MKRRDFIAAVAASGGSVYAAMQALNLLGKPAKAQTHLPKSSEFRLPRRGRKERIIILGAGIAGMTAAYEFLKVGGYHITILEARERSGGRCWTIRDGDSFVETTGIGQKVRLNANGQRDYFNPGPARIPQHHVTIDYCKELGVQLEIFSNLNFEQYYYNEGVPSNLSGQLVRAREAKADMRGYISELLAKAVDKNAIDAPLTEADKAGLVEYLKIYGDLDPNLFYKGSNRRGYVEPKGAGDNPGVVDSPFDLGALINLGFQKAAPIPYEAFEHDYDQQTIMFEPVGGIDMIAKALEREVGSRIQFRSEVREIRKTNNGVRVVYKTRNNSVRQITGDYCICTIPLPVLKNIPSDFSANMKTAIASVDYMVTGKSGLMFNRRFWEEDENILGGITWTNLDLTNIWYPSHDFLSNAGLVVGYYNFQDTAAKVAQLHPRDRLRLAVELGSRIHGDRYKKHFVSGASVYWPQIPYNLGAWASYTSATRQQYYPRLNQPDGNIYLCGEHLSYLTGWMAGAFESARVVVSQINARGPVSTPDDGDDD